jgi:glucose uptake protein
MNLGVLLALATGVFTLLGNVFAKEWSLKRGVTLFTLACVSYFISALVFMFALRYGGLVVLNAISGLATLVATAVIGVLLFKEIISTPQMIGLFLGVTAIVLLTIPRHA